MLSLFVTLHWLRARAGRSDGDLALTGRVDVVLPRCLVESVKAELSVRAHVIFSCEGRLKVAKTFVHERVILSIYMASYLA